jgi:hypothetical protein
VGSHLRPTPPRFSEPLAARSENNENKFLE